MDQKDTVWADLGEKLRIAFEDASVALRQFVAGFKNENNKEEK